MPVVIFRLKNKWPKNKLFSKATSIGVNRTKKFITFSGQRKGLYEWARELNISRSTLQSRIRRGLPIEKVLIK